MKIKKLIKNNLFLYNLLINFRDKLRIIYNQKRRSRFFWNLRDGDNKLSFNYPLSEESIFFDVGGHLGNFSKKIIEKFDCKVYIFEPVEENFKILKNIKIKLEIINFYGEKIYKNCYYKKIQSFETNFIFFFDNILIILENE